MCHLCGNKSRPHTKPKKRNAVKEPLRKRRNITETLEQSKRGEIKKKDKYKLIGIYTNMESRRKD